jgi:hypothetical protein
MAGHRCPSGAADEPKRDNLTKYWLCKDVDELKGERKMGREIRSMFDEELEKLRKVVEGWIAIPLAQD